MNRSTFFKLFSGYFFIAVALSLAVFFLSFRTIRAHELRQQTVNLQHFTAALNPSLLPLVKVKNYAKLARLVRSVGARTNKRITVIDLKGNVLADSEKSAEEMENHASRPEVSEALSGKTGTSLRLSTTVNEEMLYVAVPLVEGNRVLAVVRTSLYFRDFMALLSQLRAHILFVTLLVLLFALAVASLLSNAFARPVKLLSAAARSIAGGDYSTKISFKNSRELQELSDSFNHMTERLRESFESISYQKDELKTIIASIRESLFVINKDERVSLCNDSFRELSPLPQPEGRFSWELLREPAFSDLIARARREKQSASAEVDLEGKSYIATIAPLDNRDEYVVLLHDITQLKNLAKTKKDFVANISHELRTPLTAIKGFIETMEEGVAGNNRHYLDIVRRHTERLFSIVEDLLTLSELEEKGSRLEPDSVHLPALLNNAKDLFEKKAKEKNLVLSVATEGEVPEITADGFRLEQVFVNLIDNAIKYTDRGEICATVRCRGKEVEVEIADTGIGIPQEHLPRIFERFYVVDKSRSKKSGGTGLGLSIVKHIVLMHNGRIDVDSFVGRGSRFTVALPLSLPPGR